MPTESTSYQAASDIYTIRPATTLIKRAIPHAETPDTLDAAPGLLVVEAAAPVGVPEALPVLPPLPPDAEVVLLALPPPTFCLLYAAAVTVNV